MDIGELNKYIVPLDDFDERMVTSKVVGEGIEKYLSQQLVYLDCSRVSNNLRMMQTLGYPYRLEISRYIYALEDHVDFLTTDYPDDFDKQSWIDKLIELHNKNLKYEEENPPVWYGGKKAKNNWDKKNGKLPRKRKYKEQTIPNMGKELTASQKLKHLSATFTSLKFNIKVPKK